MDPKLIQEALDALVADDAAKALEILKALIASAAGADPGSDPGAGGGDGTPGAADMPPSEAMAAMRELLSLTSKASIGEAIADVKALFAASKAAAETAAKDAAALELSSRRDLVGELVKLGVEFPATAWEGDPKDLKPVARLSAEPLDALRKRVAMVKAARPTQNKTNPGAPSQLSAEDQKIAESITDPAKKERFISLRLSRTRRAS